MGEAVRFVIAGTGNIAKSYIKAINNIDGATAVGCISRSGRKPEGVDTNFESAPSLKKMKCDYDCVILAVPNGLHHDYTIEAASMGKHVLSEKCLDISEKAMDSMIEACDHHNVKLGVTYQKRMYPDNRIIKELLDSGTLGKTFAVELNIKCFRDQPYYDSSPYRGGYEIDGGGAFIQQGAHNIDILAWFFGKPERTVSMLGTFTHDIEAEDHGIAILRYPDGMIASITASTCTYPGFPPEMHIHTDLGSFSLINDKIANWNISGVKKPEIMQDLEIHSAATSASVSATGGHEAIIIDFIDAIQNDREPEISGRKAKAATEIVLDIYKNNVK